MSEVRDMTIEMRELYYEVVRVQARAEALKYRTFCRTQTLIDALVAESFMLNRFWVLVSKTWPETKSMSGTMKRDLTISFSK